jgi:hypothetical protein
MKHNTRILQQAMLNVAHRTGQAHLVQLALSLGKPRQIAMPGVPKLGTQAPQQLGTEQQPTLGTNAPETLGTS